MNFYEFGVNEMKNRGMFKNQAEEVMQNVISDSESNAESVNREMEGRWGDSIDDYPPMLKVTVFMGIEPFALEYIKKNCPEAWFRPMFDRDHPLRKKFEEQQQSIKD